MTNYIDKGGNYTMALADTLSDRMKEYESNTQTKLIKKLPVIIRLDGRSFSKYTKGFTKPFDIELSYILQDVALELRKEIENAKFIYSQSDEISILLTDWDKSKPNEGGRIDTWYDYRIQKIVSVASAIATAKFNEYVYKLAEKYEELAEDKLYVIDNRIVGTDNVEYYKEKAKLLKRKLFKATFDARVFNLPTDEVVNYFIYRQQDALRNSISSLARKYYSTKQLVGVNNPTKIQMLETDYGVVFDRDITQLQKLGFTVITNLKAKENNKEKFEIDTNIPIFKDNRDYIERYL